MKKKIKMKEYPLDELTHWLAYNYPGVYRNWCDNQTQKEMLSKASILRK